MLKQCLLLLPLESRPGEAQPSRRGKGTAKRIKKKPRRAETMPDDTDAESRAESEAGSETSSRAPNKKVGTTAHTTSHYTLAYTHTPLTANLKPSRTTSCGTSTSTKHTSLTPTLNQGFTHDSLIV